MKISTNKRKEDTMDTLLDNISSLYYFTKFMITIDLRSLNPQFVNTAETVLGDATTFSGATVSLMHDFFANTPATRGDSLWFLIAE